MTTTQKVCVGLAILASYEGGEIVAEHDIIYAGPRSDRVTDEDHKQALLSLGWFVDKNTNSWAIRV